MLDDITRKEMISIFQDTNQTVAKKYLSETLGSIKRSVIYRENDKKYIEPDDKRPFENMEVHVYKGTTVGTAIKLKKKYPDDKVAILNFASAKHPGGMVTNGSVAQEECICRCSNLYQILSDNKFEKDFYDYHRYSKKKYKNLYTSRLIYSPDVILFRNDEKKYHFNQYNKIKKNGPEYTVDVITCAAPNLRGLYGKTNEEMLRNNDMYEIYVDRIRHIFLSAYTNKVDHLVLGAFGCGVFRNSPNEIATAFHEVQDEFRGCFKSIVYAIYCGTDKSSVNYDVFRTEFKLSWVPNNKNEI